MVTVAPVEVRGGFGIAESAHENGRPARSIARSDTRDLDAELRR
jgi:hypothetical protein